MTQIDYPDSPNDGGAAEAPDSPKPTWPDSPPGDIAAFRGEPAALHPNLMQFRGPQLHLSVRTAPPSHPVPGIGSAESIPAQNAAIYRHIARQYKEQPVCFTTPSTFYRVCR